MPKPKYLTIEDKLHVQLEGGKELVLPFSMKTKLFREVLATQGGVVLGVATLLNGLDLPDQLALYDDQSVKESSEIANHYFEALSTYMEADAGK